MRSKQRIRVQEMAMAASKGRRIEKQIRKGSSLSKAVGPRPDSRFGKSRMVSQFSYVAPNLNKDLSSLDEALLEA